MIRTTFLFALACMASASSIAADAVIALRSQAALSGLVFCLQDIADVRQAGSDAGRRLAAMEIGLVPRPGHTERLSRQQVARAIETQAPEWRGKFQMGGSELVAVRGTGVAVGQQRLLRLATDALQAALDGRYEKVEITQVGRVRELAVPVGAGLRARPVKGPLSRRMAVWIDIEVDGRPYAALPVWFAVAAWKAVPVAKTDLPAGTILRSDDLVLELRDVAQAGKVLDRMPSAPAERLRRAIARGMPVAESAFEPVAAISRNQPVTVTIAAGSIAIETAGIAQADGRVGDVVKIKNPGSSELFLATVLEPGVVSVNAR